MDLQGKDYMRLIVRYGVDTLQTTAYFKHVMFDFPPD